jgi:galactokinase
VNAAELSKLFEAAYGRKPAVSRAPGRVNLIGEHTDYNDGFVMPAALEFRTLTAFAPRQDRTIVVRSAGHEGEHRFDLDAPAPARKVWSDYVFGVAVTLERAGHRLTGADLFIHGDVPLGSGLSSSAALEVSVGHALLRAAGLEVSRVELAKLCQRAENEYVGMRCGIMDQYISCCGVAGHALLIDCRSLEARPVALPKDARIVVANSMVHHQHAGGGYNSRREACEEGVARLKPHLGAIKALRDVTLDQLESSRSALSELVYRRCRHVVAENARVLAAEAALKRGAAAEAGRLMDASHVSMRDDYEISCPEIDQLVALTQKIPGVYGSRMTGGGFGGCTVSLVEAARAEAVMAAMRAGYRAATGIEAPIFACAPGAGVGDVAV